MSKDILKKHSRSLDRDYQIIPKDLCKDKRLTPFARLVLIYLLSNSDEWVVRMEYAAFEVGVNVKTFTGAIRELCNVGFISREWIRKENGHFSHYAYEISHEPIFENEFWAPPKKRDRNKKEMSTNDHECMSNTSALSLEGVQPQAQKPPMVKPPMVKGRLPMPNKPMPNKQALEKAMPSHSTSFQAMQASPSKKTDGSSASRKHKRKEDHQERFEYLMGLMILDDKGFHNENDMSFLSFTYSQKQLENAYYHMLYKIENKGIHVKNTLAFFKFLLKNEHNCRTPDSEINEAFARKFATELGWGSLEFKEKYVIDRGNSGKDLSFNMPPASFRDSLGNLYMSIHSEI